MRLKHVFNLISVFGVSALAIPVVFLLLGGIGFPHDLFFLPVATVISVVLGYALQHLSAWILGQKVSTDGYGDNGSMENFRVAYAMVPLCLLVIAAVLVYFDMKILLDFCIRNEMIQSLRSPEVYAFIGAGAFLICSVSGVVIWFYPMERLASTVVGIVGFAFFWIEFILGTIFSPREYCTEAVCVCLGVFTICLMVIYNQTNMQQTYRGTVVADVSHAARAYNLLLVLFLLIGCLLVFGIFWILLQGLYIMGTFLFYLVCYKLLHIPQIDRYRGDYYYPSSEEAMGAFTVHLMNSGAENVLNLFFALVLVFVFLIVGAKTGILWKMIDYVKNAIRDFLLTIKLGKEIIDETDPFDSPQEINYKDEKIKLQDALIYEYMDMAVSTDKYSLFLRRIAKLPDSQAQLSFAYAMLVTVLRKESSNLRLSDTPREIQGKVKHLVSENDITLITRQFEFVKYGGIDLTDEEASHVLDRMCDVIKRYIF